VTTRTLQMLLSLVDRPLHGYGIRQAVMERTGGTTVVGSGTLYEAVDRLLGKEWISEVTVPPNEPASGGPPRRYYALTPAGRAELTAELERLDAVVRFARGRNLLGDA
jgi:PadR family transcriptional regulator PadR